MESESGVRAVGVVKFFNQEKGFGFCSRPGEVDVFIHMNELKRSGITTLVKEGEKLEFLVVPVDGKGPKGVQIRRVEE